MTCLLMRCHHVSKMSKMLAQHWEKILSQPAIRHVGGTSAKILPACWLILIDIKKKQQNFKENCILMVWFGARCSENDIVCISILVKYRFFLKWPLLLSQELPDESWMCLGSHVLTHQPTWDPAMNPVMALATFDISQFLADNVGVMVTCAKMLLTCPAKDKTWS